MLLTFADLEAGLDEIRRSPAELGTVSLIVRRPATGEREVVNQATLDLAQGVVGDNWLARGNPRRSDGQAEPDAQVTLMNARAIALIAVEQTRWPLAGDQLYVDFDLSQANLPPGTRLSLGTAVVEITALPHTGCKQFAARFGTDAVKFVNSPAGKTLRLRGVNARVVTAGMVRSGDTVTKLPEI